MPSSQPLNTTIQVFRRTRAYRQDLRHEAVKSLVSNGHRGLVVSVPGEEYTVGQTRAAVAGGGQALIHTSLAGANNFVNAASDTRGLPIATVPETFMTVSQAYGAAASDTMDFPVRLPGVRDFQIQKNASFIGQDLYGDLKDGKTCVRLTGAE